MSQRVRRLQGYLYKQTKNTVVLCMVAASGLYGTLSYGRVVQTRVLLVYVRGVIVCAPSALPSVCMCFTLFLCCAHSEGSPALASLNGWLT